MINMTVLKKEYRRQKDGYLFILPQMILFLVFMIYPVFEGLKLSLYHVNFISQTFVGFSNYISLFKDSVFLKAIVNNIQFVILVTGLSIVFGLFISTTIYDKTQKYMSFIRACYYAPVMVTFVAFSMVWLWMLNPAMGLFTYIMNSLGLKSVNLLGSTSYTLYILIAIMWLFNLGEAVILYLAAILGIDQTLFEAAQIDGASRFKVIWHIIIPLVKPTTFYFMLLCFIDTIKVFLVVAMMTSGGPDYSTTSMMYMCYQDAFVNNDMGRASAIGMIMFGIVLILSLCAMTQFNVVKKKKKG